MAGYGDIFLSDSISELLSRGIKNIFEREGAAKKFKKLSSTLRTIEGVLVDAEEQQINKLSVKNWLSDLRDIWYDLDDILDEINGRALIRNFDESIRPKKPSSSVSRFLPSCSRNTASTEDDEVIIDRKMMQRIDDITRELDRLSNLRKQFNLMEMSKLPDKPKYEYIKPSPLLEKHHVYGRDEEKEDIIRLLLERNGEKDDMLVIPIIGIGGIGKTTLAKLVYFDERVGKPSFDVKAWTCVSDNYNEVAIIKKIYEDVTGTASVCHDLDTLLGKLKLKLANKKFLIVLDDVWNDSSMAWCKLSSPFYGKPGSRIIVTTRNQSVVDTLGSPLVTQRVRSLSNEECQSILCHHAGVSIHEYQDLEEIGNKLVEKCGGLPLAAKALGGVLRSKKKKEDWEKVLHSNIWNQPLESEILPVLRLSYFHLPPNLKNLFAYCAIFPKDCEFKKNVLVRLWMAEGLIKEGDAGESKEKIGLEYFDDLCSRSFFLPLRSNSSSTFLMHDLMNDLARHVAGGICHHFELKKHNDSPHKVSQKIRHSCYEFCDSLRFDKFQNLPQAKGLRSFLQYSIPDLFPFLGEYVPNKILFDVILKLHCLRVLSLPGHLFIKKLPDSLFELIHLRYLDLSRTSIVELPDSLGNLVFLEFLLLRYCYKLKKLPKSLGSLSKLRHLDNTGTRQLELIPGEIRDIKSLRVLTSVVLNRVGGLRLKHLEDLMLLEGALSISQLENATAVEDGNGNYLMPKHRLEELELRWSGRIYRQDPLDNIIPPEDVIETMLRPHENLRELRIYYYGGSTFPSWIGDKHFMNLTAVRLEECTNCSSLPPLGQLPNLERLHLEGLWKVERIDEGFYGNSTTPFPKLHKLCLVKLTNLREWIGFTEVDDGISHVKFNCLGELAITECPQLETAPQLILPSLSDWTIRSCSGSLLQKLSNLHSLERLVLEYISGLTHLPSELVRSLVALKELEIYGCRELDIDPERLSSCMSLNTLKVGCCANSCQFLDQGLPPNLRKLEIKNCADLESLPRQITAMNSLLKLEISGCFGLVSFPSCDLPPSLHVLIVSNCKVLRPLKEWGLHNLSRLTDFTIKGGYEELKQLSDTKPLFPPSLEFLSIEDFPKLNSLADVLENLNSLRYLLIWYCEKMDALPSEHVLKNLSTLNISKCPLLQEKCAKDKGEYWPKIAHIRTLQVLEPSLILDGCGIFRKFLEEGLPTNLWELQIKNFADLESLPREIVTMESLQILEISHCSGLISFPSFDLPPSLRELRVWNCKVLRPLKEWGLHNLSRLTHFTIQGGYEELEQLSDTEPLFPPSLEFLWIGNFPKLNSLADVLENLNSLRELSIVNCEKMEVLPSERVLKNLSTLNISYCPLLEEKCAKDKGEYWPKIAHIRTLQIRVPPLILDGGCDISRKFLDEGLPSNLLELQIKNFADLESLPRQIITVESLEILRIYHCSGLISFPSFDFPPSLLSLRVLNCKVLRPLKEWGLHNLSRLTLFGIEGGYEELEQLSDTKPLFPPSLEFLYIGMFPRLNSLTDVLENLNSLRHLAIRYCEKMDTLPSEHVLKNLSTLNIFKCPLLEEKCAKDKGEYWPKIAHIPKLEIG